MDPVTAAAGIGALGSLAGGFIGSSSAKKARKQAQAQFNAQMDQSIQRRVIDAKKAGVHPLFALGASVGASPTISAGADNSMASGVEAAAQQTGNALQSWGNRKIAAVERDLGIRQAEANISRTEAERDLALAQAAASTDAMLRQRANVTQDLNGQIEAPPKPRTLYTPAGEQKTGPTMPQQEYEDEYGGVVGELYGMMRWLQDRYNEVPKTTPGRRSARGRNRSRARQ